MSDLRERIAAQARRREELAKIPLHERRLTLELQDCGWTRKQYDATVKEQGGVCAICGTEETPRRRLHPEVGGVLVCGPCTDGLTCFKDDPHLLEIAAALLRSASEG